MLEILLHIYLVVAICFLLNLIPFCIWAARKKPTSEILLYQVRGRFSYFNVLVWLDEIEKSIHRKLTEERKWIRTFKRRSDKVKKPFYRYKRNVKDILWMKYFGSSPRTTAFLRMSFYSRIVYIFHMVLSLTIINCVLFYFLTKTDLKFENAIIPTLVGGGPLFLIVFTIIRIIINAVVLLCAHILIFTKGDAGYFHELIYQFEGVYNGHFKNLNWDDTPSTKLSGLDVTSEGLDYIKNTYFEGGSSSGTW